MKVGDWMTAQVQTCRVDQTLNDAAHLFWSHDRGWIPVLDSRDRVVGVVTDRDACLGAHFNGRALADIPVAETMARPVQTCRATDDLVQTLARMGELRVRRMPVVDGEGALLGAIGVADVARAALAAADASAREHLAAALLRATAAIVGAAAQKPVRPAASSVEIIPEPKRAAAPAPAPAAKPEIAKPAAPRGGAPAKGKGPRKRK